MAEVFDIHQKKTFTLAEAKQVMPVVRRITESAYEEIQKLGSQLRCLTDSEKKKEVEDRIQHRFEEWYTKIRHLGAESKGVWLVDFDSGEGYFCWHYPEPELTHFHGYTEGFKNRVKIQ